MSLVDDGAGAQEAANQIVDLITDDLMVAETEEDLDRSADEEDDAESEDEENEEEEEDDQSDETDDDLEDDDEEDAGEVDEGDDEETYVVVKIDGEEHEVTLDEAIKGYQRTADYTRKTQELASQRKELADEFAETREQRDQYAARLEQAQDLLEQLMPPEPDWDEVRKRGKDVFTSEYAAFQQRKQKMDALQAERERVAEEQAKDYQRQMQDVLATESQKLMDAFPEWKDQKVAQRDRDAMFDYGGEQGFTQEELETVMDARAVKLLWKAMKYDELQSKGKRRIEGKKKKRKKTLRPGGKKSQKSAGRSSKKEQALRKKLARSGKTSDAAAVFESMIPDDEFDR
jgi:hypothetical protein